MPRRGSQAQADEANLRPFRAQAEALRKRLEPAKERLPSEQEIPQVCTARSPTSRSQSGLGVALFQPKAAEDRDVLSEVPIAVTAEGTYHQLGSLLGAWARCRGSCRSDDFRLIGIDRPTGTVRAEMTLTTYIFRPEGSAAAPSRRAGPASRARPPGRHGGTGTVARFVAQLACPCSPRWRRAAGAGAVRHRPRSVAPARCPPPRHR